MARRYTALIRKEPNTRFWIDCLDFPGCIASGETLEEAKKLYAEGLKFHLKGTKEDDKDYRLPTPLTREEVLADENTEGALLYTIDVEEPD
jgi:predicted RNase H-like HicB family nuclease